MIEAMACGTPGTRVPLRLLVSGVIDNGVTGRVVDSEAEALAALLTLCCRTTNARCGKGSKKDLRPPRMAKGYVSIYRQLLMKQQNRTGPRPRALSMAATAVVN